jgi:hypothetical protein
LPTVTMCPAISRAAAARTHPASASCVRVRVCVPAESSLHTVQAGRTLCARSVHALRTPGTMSSGTTRALSTSLRHSDRVLRVSGALPYRASTVSPSANSAPRAVAIALGAPFLPSVFLDKNRRDIREPQSTPPPQMTETARSRRGLVLADVARHVGRRAGGAGVGCGAPPHGRHLVDRPRLVARAHVAARGDRGCQLACQLGVSVGRGGVVSWSWGRGRVAHQNCVSAPLPPGSRAQHTTSMPARMGVSVLGQRPSRRATQQSVAAQTTSAWLPRSKALEWPRYVLAPCLSRRFHPQYFVIIAGVTQVNLSPNGP